jgi:hypothetical protein
VEGRRQADKSRLRGRDDLGALVVNAGEPYVGIAFLRPGHTSVSFVLEILLAVESTATDVEPPFLVVAERRADVVQIRVRSASQRTCRRRGSRAAGAGWASDAETSVSSTGQPISCTIVLCAGCVHRADGMRSPTPSRGK